MAQFTKRLSPGDRVHVSGDSSELWISDYDVRVDTGATVLEAPEKHAQKVLLSLDYIDHQVNVAAYVRIGRLLPPRDNDEPATWTAKNALECMAGQRVCQYHNALCPYWDNTDLACNTQKAAADTLAYIKTLEDKLAYIQKSFKCPV